MDLLRYVDILLGLGSPSLDAVFQMWAHKSQRERVVFLHLLAKL